MKVLCIWQEIEIGRLSCWVVCDDMQTLALSIRFGRSIYRHKLLFTRRLRSWSQLTDQSIGVVADLCVTIKWLLRTMTRQKSSFSIGIFDEICWKIVIRWCVLCYSPYPFIRQSITLELDDSLSHIERSSGRPGAVVPRFDCILLGLCQTSDSDFRKIIDKELWGIVRSICR